MRSKKISLRLYYINLKKSSVIGKFFDIFAEKILQNLLVKKVQIIASVHHCAYF